MKNQINKFMTGLLQMNRIALFLLIVFPITLKVSTPTLNDNYILNHLLGSIGGFFLFCWLVAIGQKASKKLISNGIDVSYIKYFNWSIAFVIVTYTLILIIGSETNIFIGNINFYYTTPIYLPIIFWGSLLSIIIFVSKSLVSAERLEEVGIGDYFWTVILLVFSAIGLWFVQPRVQKI
jgi:hypothetical protein